jgi:hypothetical protein
MTKSIATFTQGSTVPAHLQNGAGLGNENVDASALTIPKLDIIQSLSPQKQKSSPKYIEGAEEGKIFNSLTGELYDNVFVINLMYETQFAVFKQRKYGAGFEGAFDTAEAAHKHLEANDLDPKQYDVVETGIHKCLMLDENGHPKQPVLIYMAGSKQRVSRAWNTSIQLEGKGADRFATVWTLSTVEETNKQGQPYFNFKVDFAGFAGEELYNEAKKNYFALKGEPVPAEQ